MTDRELAEAAVAALKRTTIPYPEWERRKSKPPSQGGYADVTKTNWWQALDALRRIAPPATAIPPSELYAMLAATGKASDVAVSGDVTLNAKAELTNVNVHGVITINPAADGTVIGGGAARAFYLWGAQGVHMEAVAYDGQGVTDDCKLWGQGGKLPSVDIIECGFKHFSNDNNVGLPPGVVSHNQAIFVGSSERVRIRGCDFDDNGNSAHVFVSTFGSSRGGPKYVELTGNTFGPTHKHPQTGAAYFAVNVHSGELPFNPATPIYVEPGQPSVVALCSDMRWVRAAP